MYIKTISDKEETSGGRRPYDVAQVAHLKRPDFCRAPFNMPETTRKRMLSRLGFLYGPETAEKYLPELERICQVYHAYKPEAMLALEQAFAPNERFTEDDIILITYGDLVHSDDQPPLAALNRFCGRYLTAVNTIHILPFFPASSDRGFAVMDFETVAPHLGTWEDIEALAGRYHLMFDGVINHVSSRSRWFEEFLKANPYYKNFFIAYDDPGQVTNEQRMLIARPRPSDILTRYQTLAGAAYVWTTFSEDQIDLNYHHPDVLMRVIEILLFYVRHGVDIIRLDAAAYLWSEPGTRCVNLPQTHEIIKLIRDVLNLVAPAVSLITETNVTHQDNMAYFGNGHDEAHMVYNFALPPLVLHTFSTQDAGNLTRWAGALETPSKATTFFNFLDSHDGIGLMAVEGILTPEEINGLVETAAARGGGISYTNGPDGRKRPYELNITWFSALNPEDSAEDPAFQIKRFVASRAISLVLQGVPGIYLHSFVGTRNHMNAAASPHSQRAINRSVIHEKAIQEAMKDPMSKVSRISREFGRLITIRSQQRAFHPNGAQRVLSVCPAVFTLVRWSPEGDETILCLINVTPRAHHMEILTKDIGSDASLWYDLVSGIDWMVDEDRLAFTVHPYDVIWLQPVSGTGDFLGW